jgi:5'-nucleotidase
MLTRNFISIHQVDRLSQANTGYNRYPATAMRYGISDICPSILGVSPAIAIAGFNVGLNSGSTVQISGTVGAAVEAVQEGIPAIAFSGASGSQVGYTTTTQNYQTVYVLHSFFIVHVKLSFLLTLWRNV